MSNELAKVFLIIAKVLLIIVLMFMGVRAHYLNSKRVTRITVLFGYYILVMLGLVLQEFFFRSISFLFYVMLAAGMGQIL